MTEHGVLSCSSDEEVVNVPPFVPSPSTHGMTELIKRKPPFVEVAFSNLTREASMKIKEALVKWAESLREFSPEQDTAMDSNQDHVRLSGKFRFEANNGESPRIVYIPPTTSLLDKNALRDAWTVNKTVEKALEAPLYERSVARLPKISENSTSKEMRPVFNHKCYNCGSYHHQVRTCPRSRQSNQDAAHRSYSEAGNGEQQPSSLGSIQRGRGRLARKGIGRARSGRSTLPVEDSGRYMNQSIHFQSEPESQRKRNRSRDFSDAVKGDGNVEVIPLIKIISDSESEANEEEALEEGEYVDNAKKMKITEVDKDHHMSENEIEEGEIIQPQVSTTLSSPLPTHFLPHSSVMMQQPQAIRQVILRPPLPLPPSQVIRVGVRPNSYHLPLRVQTPHQTVRPVNNGVARGVSIPRAQSHPIVYLQQQRPISQSVGNHVVTNPQVSGMQQAPLVVYRPPGCENIFQSSRSGGRGPPLQTTTAIFQPEQNTMRPVHLPLLRGGGGLANHTVIVPRPDPSSSGLILLDRNGKPLLVRPRPR